MIDFGRVTAGVILGTLLLTIMFGIVHCAPDSGNVPSCSETEEGWCVFR